MSDRPDRTRVTSAGQVIDLPLSGRGASHLRRGLGRYVDDAVQQPGRDGVDVRLNCDPAPERLRTQGLGPVTRGAWASASGGRVVLRDVGGSGWSQEWSIGRDRLTVSSRWAPSALEALAAAGLAARRRALFGQVLLHYPTLWWAGVRGLAPLHVSVVCIEGVSVLLAGPGGVGKSSLVARELGAGATATCDNLAVTDGVVVHGLREPLRLPAEVATGGSRAAHGRRDDAWVGWVPTMVPDLLVVLRRGDRPGLRDIDAEQACRALVAGTLVAGELRRFWPLQATLALATPHGLALPAVEQVAQRLSRRLPCVALDLGERPGAPLRTLLAGPLADVRRERAAS